MTCVIRIVAVAGAEYQAPDRVLYLESFDVDAFDGRGDAKLTPIKADALRFEDFSAAMAAWRMPSKVQPVRTDGRPNRPLTAYTVEIEAV